VVVSDPNWARRRRTIDSEGDPRLSHEQSGLIVRPVRRDDFDQWSAHWKSYQQFYKVALTDDVTERTWLRFFDADEPVYSAVALEGTRILGFANYLFHRSTWAQEDFCYLEDLFVAQDARGRQIGKRLIEHVRQQARDRGSARLYWHTQETNLTAQRLYDWIGRKAGSIEYRMALT
jgi:GNAT superfamily N-acetyltransferase